MDLVTLRDQLVVNSVIGQPGDSGSPVYQSNQPWIALGIFSGGGTTQTHFSSLSFMGTLGIPNLAIYGTSDHDRAFLTMQYDGALHRFPDQAGFDSWLSYLGATCDAQRIRNTAAAFYWSGEHRALFPISSWPGPHHRVRSIYRGMLGREPDAAGWTLWADYVWSGGPPTDREARWDYLVGQFANSPEFTARITAGAAGEQPLCP